MDISFIIPTYNEAKRIADTVKQFAQLRQLKYEIIVSDNGSTDDTRTLARPFVSKVINRPTDMPTTIGECRNRGAKPATGEILWFIDADVRIADLAVTADEVVHYFHKHIQCVGLVLRLKIYHEEATSADRFWLGVMDTIVFTANRIFKTGAAPGDCMIIRRSAFERSHGFWPDLATSEDYDLFSRLSKLGDIAMFWHRYVEMSPRRVRRDGWLPVLAAWQANWFRRFILRRSTTADWVARR